MALISRLPQIPLNRMQIRIIMYFLPIRTSQCILESEDVGTILYNIERGD